MQPQMNRVCHVFTTGSNMDPRWQQPMAFQSLSIFTASYIFVHYTGTGRPMENKISTRVCLLHNLKNTCKIGTKTAEHLENNWHQRTWRFSLHLFINAEHEARQAASTVFQIFGMTWPGFEPTLLALVACAQLNAPVMVIRFIFISFRRRLQTARATTSWYFRRWG